MNGINKATVLGTVGSKPHLIESTSKPMTSVSVVTSNRSGNQTYKQWHRIVLFGRMAEIACDFLDKGSIAYFEGPMHMRQYNQNGNERTSFEIVASVFEIVASPKYNRSEP